MIHTVIVSGILTAVFIFVIMLLTVIFSKKNALFKREISGLKEQQKEEKEKFEKEMAELKHKERDYQRQIDKLKEAINPDSFDGLFPICSNCKDIRDSKGYWHSIEEYVQNLSEAEFSHSLCPECAKKLYPDLFDGEKKAISLKWKQGADRPLGGRNS